MPRKAIFLDRDGVINVDAGYVHLPRQVEFIPGIFDFCRRAQALGYMLIAITNQSGIGRGFYSEDDFHALMRWMQERFEKEQCKIAAYYFCPHHPAEAQGEYKRECDCRKPKPGMIIKAAREWDIDLAQSIMIGDQQRDIDAGQAAGVGRVELFKGEWPVL